MRPVHLAIARCWYGGSAFTAVCGKKLIPHADVWGWIVQTFVQVKNPCPTCLMIVKLQGLE